MTEESVTEETDPRVVVVDSTEGPHPERTEAEVSVGATGGGVAGLTDLIEQPAKVMRIGSMVKQLLEEVKAAPLDEKSRDRLRDIHESSIRELAEGLAPELREELQRLSLPFDDASVPSDSELRVAQAQLVGWLEGVFHGIQTALFAQQVAARAQLEELARRPALPPGQAAPASGGPYL